MMADKCFEGVCFFSLDPNGPKFFGFSEFLTGLALMVLAWTIADVRYQFRLQTAPVPLRRITFGIVTLVGVLTLLTDLWRAQGWMVPEGNLLTPASWQAFLAGLFLVTFLAWTWFAFIKPPIFGKMNAERYARTLYRFIIKGDPAELSVVADELTRSAKALVRYATDRTKRRNPSENKKEPSLSKVQAFANDILIMMADKRLCRVVVESSPGTALAFFVEMGVAKKYGIQVEIFARNIMNEALMNKDSFLYHETEGYESGIVGYLKPLSQAMFSNFQMVERLGTMLDPDIRNKSQWDADQLEAYCRAVLMTFRDYVGKAFWNHSFVLYRAKGNIERATSDLYKLNGVASSWDNDCVHRLRVVVSFINDAIKILDEKPVPDGICLRTRGPVQGRETFYDHIASMIFEVILHAGAVTSPPWEAWSIQHNSVWAELFGFGHSDGAAGRVVKFKLRRLLYDEVRGMNRFPNFKGATILRYCLSVMGLMSDKSQHYPGTRALHKAVLEWTKKNYAWLHSYNASVAEACLGDGISYDVENHRLIKTYPAAGLRRESSFIYFTLDQVPVQAEGTADRSGPNTDC